MRKGLLIALLLLLIGGTADAAVQVFFLPESGFLRVQGEVTMRPATTAPSLMLFPGVQVTELWADELREYSVQRGAHGTMVSLSLRQVRPQILSFSYEGFLSLQGSELVLDRSSLWFPEFSFPIESSEITVVLPDNWEIVEWYGQPPMYPSFMVRDTTAVHSQDTPQVIPVIDEFSSRVQMQLARLTSAINHRNATEIEALLSRPLRETGLAGYLASVPSSYGQITSELRDSFNVLFRTERGASYEVSVVWQENGGRLELQYFQMKPHGTPIPEELLGSLAAFVNDLRLLVQTGQRDQLLEFVDEMIAQGQGEIVEFLLGLNALESWTIEHGSSDPFTITIFVPHTKDTKLLLHLGLKPGLQNWLIHSLEIIPVG